MVWLQWETAWRVLKKILKIELLYDPEIPPLGLYPKELKAGTRMPSVHFSIMQGNQKVETTQMSQQISE